MGGGFKVKVDMRSAKKKLREARSRNKEAFRAAMYQEAVDTAKAAYPLIPVDTSLLRSTLTVVPPRFGDQRPHAFISVGTGYGVYVHERTDLSHTPPTQAKFLETPFRMRKTGYNLRLARLLKKFAKDKVRVKHIDSPFPKVVPEVD